MTEAEQMEFGQVLRDGGIELVLSHTPEGYKDAFWQAVNRLAATGHTFTPEDVRRLVGNPPNHHNAFSALFAGAVKAGTIKPVGHTNTLRPSSHRRDLKVYIGAAWAL
jgi:hypothetical protein